MKVHRIHVENFKGIDDRTLEVPESGLVIASGPNEIGKSSLIEALDLVLDAKVKHTSKHRRVLATQPVGTQRPVVVEAEFTIGPHRVVHRKQFLSSPAASLHFLAGPRAGQRLAGDEAIDAMATLWGRVDRTLWDALHLLEGSGLADLALQSSTSLARALDAASNPGGLTGSGEGSASGGLSGIGPGADEGTPLLDAVEREYRIYWTPTGKRTTVQTGPAKDLEEVVAEHDRATAALAQVDEVVAQLARADEDIAELTVQMHEATDTAQEAARRTEAVRGLEEALARARRLREDADRAVHQAELTASTRADLVARVTALTQQVDDLAGQVADLELREGEVEAERRTVREDLGRADERLTEARGRAERADDLVELLEARESLDRLDSQLARTGALSERIEALEEQIADRPISAADLARAEEAADTVSAARTRLTLASPTLAVERLGDEVDLTIDGDQVTGDLTRPLERPTRIEVAGAWALTLTPDQSVEDLAARARRAESELADVLAQLGVDDVGAARQRLAERMSREDRLRGLREDLDRALAGARLEDLREERRTLSSDLGRLAARARAAGAGAEAGEAAGTPPDAAAARAAARSAREARDEAQIARDGLATQLEAVTTRWSAAREEAVMTSSTLAARRSDLAGLTERLTAARADASDESLDEDLARCREELDRASAAVDRASRELGELSPEEVHAADEEARMHLAGAQRRLTDARARRARLEGELKGLGREDRQDRADRLGARRHRLELDVEGTGQRAEAARVLREALTSAREAQRRAYVAPFREAVQAIGRQVFDADLTVDIGDDLSLVSRTLAGRTVPWDQLSTGAREQLGLVVRLAAARLVDPEDGVPVVLDDALVHSDRVRTRRLLEQVAAGAGATQVVVLTCAPERYDRITAATRIEFR